MNKTREVKTHRQRAEEAVGVAQRRVDRIAAALEHQRSLVANYEGQMAEAEERLSYVKSDPALTDEDD